MKLAVVLVMLGRGACKDKDTGPTLTPEQMQDKARAQLAADLVDVKRRGPGFAIKPEPVAAVEATPGPAYFVLTDIGLAKLDAGKLTIINGKLPVVADIEVGKQGELYVVGDHVMRMVGSTFERLGGDSSESLYSRAAAVAPDGTLWVLGALGAVSQWNGNTWKKHDKVFPDGESPTSIVVDAKGRVYAGGKQMLVVYDGTAWQTIWDIREVFSQMGNEPPTYFQLFVTPKGELLAVSATGIATFDGKDIKYLARTVQQPNLVGTAALHGNELVVMGHDKLFRIDLATGAEKLVEEKESRWGSNGVLDAQGRVWTAPSDGGFTVIGADGTSTHFAAGSLPELTAAVKAIGVVGAGPELPKASGEIARGSIRGVVTKAGAPIAKAPVEVCSRPRQEFAKDATPCTGDKTKASATTDEKGAFQIDNLPLLDYGIAVQVEGQWYGLRGKACAGLAAGAVCDVGVLDVTSKPIF